MTRICVKALNGSIVSIKVSGHSGYADSGYDIVCAAISCLTTTCINALESVAGVKPIVAIDEHKADMSITLPDKLTLSQASSAQIVMQTVLQGFKDLSGEYQKYCQLTINDGRKTP